MTICLLLGSSTSRGAILSAVRSTPISLILTTCVLLLPSVANAGLFGGFTADGHYYKKSKDLCCTAVSGSLDAPVCTKGVGKVVFRKGQLQEGTDRKVEASKKGTKIEISSTQTGESLFIWDSGDVINSIGKVYLQEKGGWVAVEYSTRMGGRSVEELIVVALKQPVATDSLAPPDEVEPAKPVVTKVEEQPVNPAFQKALKAGMKWHKRRKYSKAIASFKTALSIAKKSPEALYRLARSQFAGKDQSAALKTLALLSEDKSAKGIEWKVEARFEKEFKSLRGNPAFRKAVGIDRSPGEHATAYERLVALGGKWEQDSLPCEQPRVNLTLVRNQAHRFDLVIRSKCQGTTETTRLDGSWLASSSEDLKLRFPNMNSDDDALTCKLEVCADGSGEDCLRCRPDRDIEFLLRVVRR